MPTVGTGQEDSALRAESVGQAQSPEWWAGRGQTALPPPAPGVSMAVFLDLGEGELPTLATLCPLPPTPHQTSFLPGSFSGYHRGGSFSSSHLSP